MGDALQSCRVVAGASGAYGPQAQPNVVTLEAVAQRRADRGRIDVDVAREVVGVHTTEPFFCWHQINAYDDGDDIVIDLVAWDDPGPFWQVDVADGRDPDHHVRFCGRARRLRIPGNGGPVDARWLSNTSLEFGQINYKRSNERPYRYASAIAYAAQDSDWFDELVKLDVETGEVQRWSEEGCYPGEPTIVALPDAESEDDVVVLNVVLDARAERSFLVVLDGRTMQEIARAELPHHLPFNFHQQFLR